MICVRSFSTAPRICWFKRSKSKSLAAARKLAEDCLNSGAPRQKWDEMIVAQGADLKAFNRKLALDSTATVVAEVKSEKSGYISKCDARIIGEVIRDLGGGRLTKESAINYDVGVDQIAKPGERWKNPACFAGFTPPTRRSRSRRRAVEIRPFEIPASRQKSIGYGNDFVGEVEQADE